jgi:Tol biopolymer transport system component
VALEIKDQQNDIWVWDLARHISTRVTTDPGLDESPVWMPDGRRLVFTSQADGGLGSLFWQAADGGGVAERLTEGKLIQRASAVLADSTKVLFSEGGDLMTLTLDNDRRVLPLVRAPHGGADSVVSPDGRWLAYAGMDSASPQIFVRPYPSTNEGRTQVSTTGGSQPRWSRNSRELFYIGIDGALMSVVVEPGATFTARTPTRVIERPYYSGLTLLNRSGTYDVSADGQRFLRIKQTGDPNQFAAPATMVVVQNWFEELKRRVPTR